MWNKLTMGIGIVAGALALGACHQGETVFVVDTLLDTVDTSPGDGICADADGACSVRAAVMEANALPGVEEIRLVDDTVYDLLPPAGANGDDDSDGDLDIYDGVVITGKATLRTSMFAAPHAIFETHHATGLVELDGLVLDAAHAGVRVTGPGALSINETRTLIGRGAALHVDDGIVVATRSEFLEGERTQAAVPPAVLLANGGRTMLDTVTVRVGESPRSAVRVAGGDAHIKFSTFGKNRGTQLEVLPGASGSLLVQSSVISTWYITETCTGEITSLGFNVTDWTCPLGHPADLEDPYPLIGTPAAVGEKTVIYAPVFSAGHDSRPVDQNCREGRLDVLGNARPAGAGCDAGAVERQPGPCSDFEPGGSLVQCDLRGLNLRYGDLTDADLTGVDARGANFERTVLDGAILDGVDFRNVDLRNASAVGASLVGADLSDSGLWLTSFIDADLTAADLTNSTFGSGPISGVTYDNTTCPTGVNSDDNGGTCDGELGR